MIGERVERETPSPDPTAWDECVIGSDWLDLSAVVEGEFRDGGCEDPELVGFDSTSCLEPPTDAAYVFPWQGQAQAQRVQEFPDRLGDGARRSLLTIRPSPPHDRTGQS